jgi:hypothetical protein
MSQVIRKFVFLQLITYETSVDTDKVAFARPQFESFEEHALRFETQAMV